MVACVWHTPRASWVPIRLSPTTLAPATPGGPLCSQCERDYFLSENDGCLVCEVRSAWVGPLLLLLPLVVVMLLGIPLAAVHRQERVMAWYYRHEEKLTEYGQRGTAVFGEWG